jgi:HEPN domain-containing protein
VEIVGFHAQQAVEKATKVVLVLAGVQLPHVHDLERLIALVSETAWPPPSQVLRAGWLTPWAVQFRYDLAIESLDQVAALAVADGAVRWASDVIDGA